MSTGDYKLVGYTGCSEDSGEVVGIGAVRRLCLPKLPVNALKMFQVCDISCFRMLCLCMGVYGLLEKEGPRETVIGKRVWIYHMAPEAEAKDLDML
jgi:hypothetical protein